MTVDESLFLLHDAVVALMQQQVNVSRKDDVIGPVGCWVHPPFSLFLLGQ